MQESWPACGGSTSVGTTPRLREVEKSRRRASGDSNTISVVDGVRATVAHLVDVPSAMKTAVVFDQSRFVRTAIETLLREGGIGLFLTGLMILMFLESLRATVAVRRVSPDQCRCPGVALRASPVRPLHPVRRLPLPVRLPPRLRRR